MAISLPLPTDGAQTGLAALHGVIAIPRGRFSEIEKPSPWQLPSL